MSRRTITLFILVCLLTGMFAFIGSAIGNVFSERGLFAGVLIGGALGVLGSTRMAIRTTWLSPEDSPKATMVGMISFFIAAWIALKNLDGPLVPVLSLGLVGLGVVAGREWSRRTRPTLKIEEGE